MRNILVNLGILLASGLLLSNGILMLVFPEKHRKFLNWWGGLPRDTATKSTGTLGGRVAGLAFLLMGFLAANAAVGGLATSLGLKAAELQAPTTSKLPGSLLVLLLFAASMILVGICALVRPQWIVQWSRRNLVRTPFSEVMLPRWKSLVRVLGVGFIVAGVNLIHTLMMH